MEPGHVDNGLVTCRSETACLGSSRPEEVTHGPGPGRALGLGFPNLFVSLGQIYQLA